jgi:prophage antirepressor-like protein
MPDTQLQIFEYGTSPVRTVMVDGEPWLVGNDLCNILEIANPRNAFARLPDTMKDVHTVDTLGGTQSMSIVSEAGMYKLVLTSRKPQAEAFTNWVASEVLPSIRKTGAYVVVDTKYEWPKTLSQGLLFAAKQQEKVEEQHARPESPRTRLPVMLLNRPSTCADVWNQQARP